MGMMNAGIKRGREWESDQFDNITTMANCLMLLSRAGELQALNIVSNNNNNNNNNSTINNNSDKNSNSRVFECKTCNKQFPSFQALGGHRASHKKPKLGGDQQSDLQTSPPQPPKPKTHECSICGLEFAVGQALGGHMRRHRAVMNDENRPHHEPVVKKSNSGSRRVWGLDLNLTPLENDLEFRLGKVVPPPPAVDCFL